MAEPFQIDETDLVSGAQRAAGWRPLQASTMREVYTGYGVKEGGKKGKSDTELYQRAATDIVSWWKKRHTEPTGSGSAPSAGGAGSPGYAGSGGSGRAGGPSMSDTAVATGPSTGAQSNPLPHILLPGEKPGTGMTKGLTTTQVLATLNKAGLGSAKPPSYALTSAAALDGWINRAYRQMGQQRPDRKPTSTEVAARLRLAGLPGARVPSYALTTTAELDAWISRALRQQQQAVPTSTNNTAAPSTTAGGYTYSRPATGTSGFRAF